MSTNILDNRVISSSGYDLLETLDRLDDEILEEQLLREGIFGDAAYRIIDIGLRSILDDATGELSGAILFIPTLYKNVVEMYVTNRKIKKHLKQKRIDRKKLVEYRKSLCGDFIDLFNNLILALPLPGIDTVLLPFGSAFEQAIGGASANITVDFLDAIKAKFPKASKVLGFLAKPLGGGVLYEALQHIDKLDPDEMDIASLLAQPTVSPTPEKPKKTGRGRFEHPETEPVYTPPKALPRPTVDDDIDDVDDLVIDDFDDVTEPLAENYTLNRWKILSGIN